MRISDWSSDGCSSDLAGPTSQGLNTRFGIYNGPVSSSDYQPDLVTTSSNPAMTYDDSLSQAQYKGQPITSSTGDLPAGGEAILDYSSEASRVGKEWVRTCSVRWRRSH